jgi:hypothetical protein
MARPRRSAKKPGRAPSKPRECNGPTPSCTAAARSSRACQLASGVISFCSARRASLMAHSITWFTPLKSYSCPPATSNRKLSWLA